MNFRNIYRKFCDNVINFVLDGRRGSPGVKDQPKKNALGTLLSCIPKLYALDSGQQPDHHFKNVNSRLRRGKPKWMRVRKKGLCHVFIILQEFQKTIA